MQAIIENQYTAARAYFLCVIALLFIESAIHLPFYYLELRNRGRPQIKSSPTHSKLSTYLHKLFTLPAFIPFIADYHLPNLLRVAVFAGLNVLWGYNSIEFSTDYTLYGWLTIANGGLALLLAARTNLFSLVLRIPSAKLLFYHRWIGIATVAHATAHFALNTQHDIRTDQLATAYSNRRIQVGIMAWLALCIIGITSISFIRRRWFEAFYYTHALFFVFVVGALIHATKGPEFLLPGLLLWGVDRAIRFVYNLRRVEVKSVTSYPGDVVKFKLEGPKVTHPGQMAWIQIPGVSFLNWHPFTIASSPGDREITVAVRGLGRYTKRLSLLASDSKVEQSEASSEATGKMSTGQIRMRLDGPYGVGGVRWGLHPVTVLVAGGIGITPGISIASHIIKQAALPDSKRSSTEQWHIHLLWVIKDIRHTTWFEDELKQLALLASSTTTPVTLDITIHVTGGSTSRMESLGQEEAYAMETPYKYDGPGMVIEGRPDITKWFGEVKSMRYGLDTVVNVCGPRPLINNVRRAAAKLSWEGGHYLVEEEVFEL